MADITANRSLPVRLPPEGLRIESLPLAGYTNYAGGSATHTVYKGAIVMCDQSDTDGYFMGGPGSVTVTNTDIFGGIAIEKQSVTSADTSDGAVKVSVAVNGVWGFAKGSMAQTDIGSPAYATDDATITNSASGGLAIGLVKEVDSTYVWVDISDYAGKVSSTTS